MGVGNSIGQAIVPAVDKLVETRYESARERAARLRRARPDISSVEIANVLIARYRKELAAAGAAAGGASAIPGVGTAGSLAISAADAGWTVGRLGEMVLSIGAAYGREAEEIEERRAWVIAVLGMASGAAGGIGGVAGQVGAKGGVKVVKAIPMWQITQLNQALGGRIVVKWGAKQGVVRLGRLVPFGLGAAIGGGGNVLLVHAVGARAKDFFDDGLSSHPNDHPPDRAPVGAGDIAR